MDAMSDTDPASRGPRTNNRKNADEGNIVLDVIMKPSIMEDTTAMVVLIAGDDCDCTKYPVHKDYVCFYSPVLKAIFNGNPPDGEMQTHVLNGCHENVLRLFVLWIYRQAVCGNDSDDYYWDLIDLWFLGGNLGIPRLQNMVIDRLVTVPEDLENGPCTAHCISGIYAETKEGSVLRKFVVAKCLRYLTPDKIRKRYYPEDFLVDYAAHIYAKLGAPTPVSWPIVASDYYISEE